MKKLVGSRQQPGKGDLCVNRSVWGNRTRFEGSPYKRRSWRREIHSPVLQVADNRGSTTSMHLQSTSMGPRSITPQRVATAGKTTALP